MTNKQAVLLIDPEARFFFWGNRNDVTGWVKGYSFETKVCANEESAWEAALAATITRLQVTN